MTARDELARFIASESGRGYALGVSIGDALIAEGWRKMPSRDALIQALDPSDADGRHLGKSHAGVVLHPRQAEAIADAVLALMEGSNDE